MHNIIVAVEQTIPDLQKKWTDSAIIGEFTQCMYSESLAASLALLYVCQCGKRVVSLQKIEER